MFAIVIAIAAIVAVIFAAIAFTMASPEMCLDTLVWYFHPNNSLDPAGRVHMFHLHPSNVVEELLVRCFHRIRTIVFGAMFDAHGSSSATELLSLYDESESVFQEVGNVEEISDEQEDFIAHYQQLGQVLDQLTGIVTCVSFVPNGNEEDRESEWRVVKRNKK
eukprot:scaffold5053_cov138-Skeletonema_dohrnii-CCMP3373.AAC.1